MLAIKDGKERAQALRSHLKGVVPQEEDVVYEALPECGITALPALRSMLFDPQLASRHYEVVHALEKLGTPACPVLSDLLRRDLEFWKAEAPKLEPGWSKYDSAPRRWQRHIDTWDIDNDVMESLVWILTDRNSRPSKADSQACRSVVAEFLKVWSANARLRKAKPAMIRNCKDALEALGP
jgi:hypothetical protein